MNKSMKVLCFCWNTDNFPLCEGYLKDKYTGEISTDVVKKHYKFIHKRDPCYNPLFFQEIRGDIAIHDPDIVVITTENEPESGTYFHSDFLPRAMPTIKYKLAVRDKYVDDQSDTAIRVSLYIRETDVTSRVVQLTKGLIFNNNTFSCYPTTAGIPKALVLYLQTNIGVFAFIGIQIPDRYRNPYLCVDSLDYKFIEGKKVDYTFLMGDFAYDYNTKICDKTKDEKERQSSLANYSHLSYIEETAANNPSPIPTYSPSYRNRYSGDYKLDGQDKAKETYKHTAKRIKNKRQEATVGFHDRILVKAKNTSKGYPISCLRYEAILDPPMLQQGRVYYDKLESDHMGVIGVYQVNK